jgi:hypothetical protein
VISLVGARCTPRPHHRLHHTGRSTGRRQSGYRPLPSPSVPVPAALGPAQMENALNEIHAEFVSSFDPVLRKVAELLA